MYIICGRAQRNGNRFYETLRAGVLPSGCERAECEGQPVCLLPDNSAWMFIRTELQIKNKTCIQLHAADITERWALAAQLRAQESELMRHSEELKDTMASLHILCREREIQRVKTRAHDILGGRLTILIHALRSGRTQDLLHINLEDLLRALQGDGTDAPQNQWEALCRAYVSIGVELCLDGALPGEGRQETEVRLL